ncbi:MAG: permease [Ignavibacteria bacterium]
MQLVYLGLIGATAGILAGMFGIGGGVLIVPALILLLGMPTQTATGTSLVALLLPVGILGVWSYYRSGAITNEHIEYGLIVAAGLFAGTYFGSQIALELSTDMLRKLFAVFLLFVAGYMFFKN